MFSSIVLGAWAKNIWFGRDAEWEEGWGLGCIGRLKKRKGGYELDNDKKTIKKPELYKFRFLNLAPRPGLEPGTCGLTVRRSTD